MIVGNGLGVRVGNGLGVASDQERANPPLTVNKNRPENRQVR